MRSIFYQPPIIFLPVWATMICILISPARAAWSPDRPLPFAVARLLQKTKASLDQEKYNEAIQIICESCTEIGPKAEDSVCRHPMVCLTLANCCLLTQDYAKAESAYLKALETAPDLLDAQLNLAKVYSDTRRYGPAGERFVKAYGISDPKKPDYLYYAAVMNLMAHKEDQAIDLFERLFAAHPDAVTIPWRENYANALMTAGYWQRAIPPVRSLAAETKGEKQIKWQETLLQIYLQADDMDRAFSYATHLSRTAPIVSKWWKALVHIQLSRGKYQDALENLLIYGFLTPLSEKEQKLCADLCLQLEIPVRAAEMYETLLKDTPDLKEGKQIIKHLVNAYRSLGMAEKAVAILISFDQGEKDPELIMLKGNLLYGAKQFKEADAAFRKAARARNAREGLAWLMAGYASWQQNDLAASRSAFEKAAQFKTCRKDAQAAMAQLERTKQM
ncbi:tetratricopeptide repeat protein [Desulfospira joergensenii]|uniref:tetratricopeptide repeat protein n=1 Tax=Desulfospira joergensenii TaxID=53329 RepID=UPI0003B463A8|nr:tetratricopeptide repeat protein [Desulfospira joergensenii]